MSNFTDSSLVNAVIEAYSHKAKSATGRSHKTAQSVGYTESDLKSIPASAQLGLGCGSPVHAANLKDTEIVIDLGSGAGIDILLAALKVGPHGQAIGIDVSADMIALARRNATEKGLKFPQVAFIQASLAEPLPITTNTVDCVLSNCVINLLPHSKKEGALKEIYRILKPGGRLVIDDVRYTYLPVHGQSSIELQIVARRPLSDEIRNDLTAYVNCISGSILVEKYKTILETSGFTEITFLETGNELQQICIVANGSSCYSASTSCKPKYDVNAWVASYQITAVKNSTSQERGETTLTPVLLRWWDAYPKVKSDPGRIPMEELEILMRESPTNGNLAVIDVRKDDRAGGHIRGSENWYAQTFYDNLPAFLEKHKNTSRVIFYCGSSSGRGPRCAGWYQDYLNDKSVTSSTAYVLQGGIKAWLAKYGDQEDLVEV
ncbi:Arsenite methyltransferase [Termitomyces sp. J132]|nr:Arsenite methyltransferase [Termitomyces sp. J132]